MTRAERRRAAAAANAKGRPVADVPSLLKRLRVAKLPGTPPALADRARKALGAYVESASAQGMPFAPLLARLADGQAAVTLGAVEAREAAARGADPSNGAACASGCAFCCILNGEDGGTITGSEAVRLHGALAPLAGAPDGRSWHRRGCPALDPETRMCRVYEARPTICRSFHSSDAAACEANAAGEPVPGARLAGAHLTYLAAHGLARATLAGRARVDTYALFDVACGAVEGRSLEDTLAAARHPPAALDAERRRTGRALERRTG
ncbi:MAG: YkgJ family cysteine cluster protein [Pseudomonadota bacterium]